MAGKHIPTTTVRAWEAMGFVWELLIALAVPIALFGFAGRWLDRTFHTPPVFFIIGLILAFVVAAALIYRKAKRLAKIMEDAPDHASDGK
jgi:F0F1-type ATP synthase assembly protein I